MAYKLFTARLSVNSSWSNRNSFEPTMQLMPARVTEIESKDRLHHHEPLRHRGRRFATTTSADGVMVHNSPENDKRVERL